MGGVPPDTVVEVLLLKTIPSIFMGTDQISKHLQDKLFKGECVRMASGRRSLMITNARWPPTTGRALKASGAPLLASYQSPRGALLSPLEAHFFTEPINKSRVVVSLTMPAVQIDQPRYPEDHNLSHETCRGLSIRLQGRVT